MLARKSIHHTQANCNLTLTTYCVAGFKDTPYKIETDKKGSICYLRLNLITTKQQRKHKENV